MKRVLNILKNETVLAAAWVLAAFGLLFIFVPYVDGACRKDPWNWEYDVAESGVEAKKLLIKEEKEN